MGDCKHEQKKYGVSYKTGRISNTKLTGVYIIAFYLCFFFNFHKLLLGTNEVLYLQKQLQVGTL